ncbi:MAG: hypothetical protein AYK19_01840 [Theionarchaea archaeon DG-70-1]|nr:MAG: hypothetical protein AYK19_01840 [Theionarchaea archaeon DG-70-1]
MNRIFTLSCILLGCLAFTEFGLRQAADAATAYMWLRLGAFWPFAISIFLHFILVFTKSRALRSRITYFLLYIPAAVLTVLALTTSLVSGAPTREYWGWMWIVPENALVYNISGIWAFFLTTLPLFLSFLHYNRTREPIEKQRAKYVLLAIFVPVIAICLSRVVFLLGGIKVPDFSVTASAIEFTVITYGIYKYNIFALTPAVAANDIVSAMSNMLFLVRTDGSISLANQSALTLLGYDETELIGQPLQRIFAEQDWKKIKSNNESPIRSQEMTFITKDGEPIPVLISISAVQDKDENNLGMLCIGSDLTDHKQAEEAQKKEVLLREIHHRVKNNMQIISSLLRLQSNYITDDKYIEMFKESQNRIKSMALIHEKLYQSRDLEEINFREYITDMVQRLLQFYNGQNIALVMDVDDILMEVDTAVPCGLIINELVSNSLKHAFPDRKGEIRVGLHRSDSTIELIVADNGVGIPDDIDFRNTETLGLRLVTILAEDQLDSEIKLTRKKGTEFCITFKDKGETNL